MTNYNSLFENLKRKVLSCVNYTVTRQYPNPVKNEFALEFTSAKVTGSTIAIYNINGAHVYQKIISANAGMNIVKVNLPQVTPGTYVVKMDNQKVSTIEIVK